MAELKKKEYKNNKYYTRAEPSKGVCKICNKSFFGRKGKKKCYDDICKKQNMKQINAEIMKNEDKRKAKYEQTTTWNMNNKNRCFDNQRKLMLKKQYNLTVEEYNKILESQQHKCAICKRHTSEFKKKFSVDHNHDNGRIRGLLCYNCNLGIGKFKDDMIWLVEAVKYINRDGRDSL